MRIPDPRATMGRMSYAVLWSTNGGAACPGKLELRRGCLLFEGAAASKASELPLDEIAAARVGRSTLERLCGRPVLVLERTENDAVRIAPIGGVGVLHELLELVNSHRNGDASSAER
jgi:hypothetical protein